ncbi:putative pectinesterase/pectinesterase inhibitor 45 [Andrographis paniculata]|uniref:putative pectinesterase/pectinesterase inhibitor 45 n=1 Tax=Andrographis paniculata TaxID=175694 RepID=UPI0021E78B2F|nr:putative pectinesterase/pectinesterase inhibitor 45 [Andrographis paniculata]
MAFQDFDLISQRREQQRKQKIRRRLMIALTATFIVLLLAGAAVGVVMYKNSQAAGEDHSSDDGKKSPPETGTKSVAAETKAVKTACAATDYAKTCEGGLEKAVVKSSGDNLAHDILKAALSVAADGVKTATEKSSSLKLDGNGGLKEAAYEDCMALLRDARDEISDAIAAVESEGVGKFSSVKPDLDSRLSAALSYQQTCVDGFPDGEAKKAMEKYLKTAKEHGSNALAIVSQSSSLLSKLSSSRKLLAADDSGLPSWMHPEARLLKSDSTKFTPNVTVAKDGSGNFSTINEALKAMPKTYKGRYVIYVKEGVYDESVNVSKAMTNVTMYGDGSQKSIVTGSKSFADGVTALQTATFVVFGDGFMAQSIGFRNTAGPDKHQAVALRVQADRAIFVNCRMEGYQSPLLAQSRRQFYRSCYITGSIDIIQGDAAAVFQNCVIYVRKGIESQPNTVTAQGRTDRHETTGFVLQNCKILADKELEPAKDKFKSYLGRPMQPYARTVVMESEIGDVIEAEGWIEGPNNATFVEYKNEGAGSKTAGRAKSEQYKFDVGKDEVLKFTVGAFLQGESWIKNGDVPVKFGMFH